MKTVIVVHYDEIALKGGNRKEYENALVRALKSKCEEKGVVCSIENEWGRIVIREKENTAFTESDKVTLKEICASTPAVAVYGLGVVAPPTEDAIFEGVRCVAQYVLENNTDFKTFRIKTARVNKNFAKGSQELSKEAGAVAYKVFKDKKVQLKHSDIVIKIEILNNEAYVYSSENGLGGLPVGMSGKAVALLSGGFDSPVATHMCAVRGVRPILVHFHSFPHTTRAAIDKVTDLGKVLREVCGPIVLITVPLITAQKQISLTAPERLRVVLYRRLMMKTAEKIAHRYGAKAIITGEAVGQVASQTLENIGAVENATHLPVLRPLSGMNKVEIINRSKKIGTHDISILPHDDTCTVFMPKSPEIRAKIADVIEAEKNYNSEALMHDMLENAETIKL